MSLPEQGGKVAVSLIENLRNRPEYILLIVVISGFMGFLMWVLSTVATQRTVEIGHFKEAINQNRDILIELQRNCVRFEPRTELMKKQSNNLIPLPPVTVVPKN